MSSQLSPTAHIIWTFEVMALLAALLRFYFDTRGYAETIYPRVLEAAEVCHYLFLHPAFFPRLPLTLDASHPAGSPPLFLPPLLLLLLSPQTRADGLTVVRAGVLGWTASADVALKPQTAQWHHYPSPWCMLALSPTLSPCTHLQVHVKKNCRFSHFKGPVCKILYWLYIG